MDGVVLGKGNFAHVELATHGVTKVKVSGLRRPYIIIYELLRYSTQLCYFEVYYTTLH